MNYKPTQLICTAVLTAVSFTAIAQTSSDYLKAGNRFFEQGDYYSASQSYKKFLSGEPGKARTGGYSPYTVQKVVKMTTVGTPASASGRKDVVYNLAESYRRINYFSKAEPYYREASMMGPVNPLAAYWHAKCERAMGNLDSAEMEFKTFQTSYTQQDDISKDVQKELDNLAFVRQQRSRKDLARYVVAKSTSPANSEGATYAPFYMNDGTLTFTSTRPDTGMAKVKNPYTNKVYTTGTSSTIGSDIQKLSLPMDGKMEQGVASFTPDGSKMFLTKWEMKDKKKVSALYTASKGNDGSWATPVKLPATINADGANTQQPFVTADGQYLLFSSDRTGGQGKFDIWYVQLSSSFEPSAEVMNMGSTVNTDGDDEAPFYHQPSQTLVVASNGRVGMGGYDLFYSKGMLGGNWEVPVNMGQPVNSVKDDIYYTTSNKTNIWQSALLSSDRDSPCCLEMYSFDRKNLPKVITGTVVDCAGNKALAGASISITDASGRSVATKTTDANGQYTITLPEYQPLKVDASNSGYQSNSGNISTPPNAEMETLQAQPICLTAIAPERPNLPVGEGWVLSDAIFEFNSATLTDSAKTALNDVVARMQENPTMTVRIESHTDDKGTDAYNQSLSNRRAKACAAYLIEMGIVKKRLTTKGMGEKYPIAPNSIDGNDNPEGRAKNRRTEFKIVTK